MKEIFKVGDDNEGYNAAVTGNTNKLLIHKYDLNKSNIVQRLLIIAKA